MVPTYQMCSRCVMDTTDPEIEFDEHGVCNHCRRYDRMIQEHVFTGEEGKRRLAEIVQEVKRKGAGKQYDCIVGVSGGVDSTFAVLKMKEVGLRPLAVHLDNGWDSELAVKNIENVLKLLHIDLYTVVLDWEEFKDLQLAFLKASTPDSEIPTDHAIIAAQRHVARRLGVQYLFTGSNHRTESHIPKAWSQGHWDWMYIKGLHRQFGTVPLRTFPHLSYWTNLRLSKVQKWVHVLNYMDYVKEDAMKVLQHELGWKYYGGKHYESIYTRFYQGYILPVKFGFDKRKVHFSSLICSGQLSKAEALERLRDETYSPDMQRDDREYVIKKFDLTEEEFEAIMRLPPKSYWDYPSYGRLRKSQVYRSYRMVIDRLPRLRRPQPPSPPAPGSVSTMDQEAMGRGQVT